MIERVKQLSVTALSRSNHISSFLLLNIKKFLTVKKYNTDFTKLGRCVNLYMNKTECEDLLTVFPFD